MPGPRLFDDPVLAARVRHEYVDLGRNLLRIAADTGFSQATVLRCMRHFGIPRRAANSLPRLAETARLMREMRDGGAAMSEIGARFGVTRQAVFRTLRHYGHDKPPVKRATKPMVRGERRGADLLAVLLSHEGVMRDARRAA